MANALTFRGATGNKILLRASVEGTQWIIDPRGTRDVSYVDVKDSRNINTTWLSATKSIDKGNNYHWDFIPSPIYWTGLGSDNNWSTTANWSTNAKPEAEDDVYFDNRTSKVSIVDSGIAGTVLSFTIAGYASSITLADDLIVDVNYRQSSAAFIGTDYTLSVKGPFTQTGGTFTANDLNIYHTFTRDSAATFTAPSGAVTFYADNSYNVTTNGIMFNNIAFQ